MTKFEKQWDSFDEYIVKDVKFITMSENAILVEWDGRKHWIPKSQICEDNRMGEHNDRIDIISSVGDVGNLAIPKWIYEEIDG